MLRHILLFVERRPVLSTAIFSILFSTLGTFFYDYYRDWKQAAVPVVKLSDIRISPESNKFYLKDDDLIPTSMELLEYLRGDIRIGFCGLSKLFPYKVYYNYLKENRKNIMIFDSEKAYFLNSLKEILLILKNKNITHKDKETFFDKVWRNYKRIWSSFDVLISTESINIESIQQSSSLHKKEKDNSILIFQKINIDNESKKEKYILRKKRGAIEYLSSKRKEDWDDLRRENEIKFYEALEGFDQKKLIMIFEKILERYENKLLPDSLKKIEYEIDQISRWEVDLIILNAGENPLGILPYAFLIVETKKPTNDYQSYKIPLEYRIDYNTLRTVLIGGKSSARITFLSKERIGENPENIKWYEYFRNGNSQCKVELYTSSKSDPVFSEYVSFEQAKL